jgi:hypothetical protein
VQPAVTQSRMTLAHHRRDCRIVAPAAIKLRLPLVGPGRTKRQLLPTVGARSRLWRGIAAVCLWSAMRL